MERGRGESIAEESVKVTSRVRSKRHFIVAGRRREASFYWKVLRQCIPVLLVKIRFREGKAWGSEKGKVLGYGLCYQQMKIFR
jgi:hypothetical protein